MMVKIIFTIQPHSIIDVITNSSSELFVRKGDKKSIAKLLKEIYPDYESEYTLKGIDDLSVSDLNIYFCYAYGLFGNRYSKEHYKTPKGFSFEEFYEPTVKEDINLFGPYSLKDNIVTENNFQEIKDRLSPKKDMFFLFSDSDNPDFERQYDIECAGFKRYHLG